MPPKISSRWPRSATVPLIQEISLYDALGDIGHRHRRPDQLATVVDTNSAFCRIPLIALLRLMHFGVTRLASMLRRRGQYDPPIENSIRRDVQPLDRKMALRLIQQLRGTLAILGSGMRSSARALRRRVRELVVGHPPPRDCRPLLAVHGGCLSSSCCSTRWPSSRSISRGFCPLQYSGGAFGLDTAPLLMRRDEPRREDLVGGDAMIADGIL